MATLNGKFYRGAVGNTVLKKYRGKQMLAIKPHISKDKMSAGSKKAAKTFGKASTLAGYIRRSLLDNVITHNYDGTMIYRFNTEILHALNTSKNPQDQSYEFAADAFDHLSGFEFNVNSPMRYQFFVKPEITLTETLLQVALPEFTVPEQVKFSKNIEHCKLFIMTTMVDLQQDRVRTCEPQLLEIDYSYPSKTNPAHTFEFEVLPGKLCIVAFSLQYYEDTFAGPFYVNSKEFNPAAVLYARIAPGEARSSS